MKNLKKRTSFVFGNLEIFCCFVEAHEAFPIKRIKQELKVILIGQ